MTEAAFKNVASSEEKHQQASIEAWLDHLQTGSRPLNNRSPNFEDFLEFLKTLNEQVLKNPSSMKLRSRLILALSAYRDLKSMWAADRQVHSHGVNRKLRQHYYTGREDVWNEVKESTGAES